jgi:hypothetical protein
VGTNTEQISICISVLELASSFGAYYVAAMSLKYEPKLSNNQACGHCYRFMSGYRQGLDGPLLDYTMKTYSGHRRIPDIVLVEVQTSFDNRRRK